MFHFLFGLYNRKDACRILKSKDKPRSRAHFGYCSNKNMVYIMGGTINDEHFNDLWYIDSL